MENNPNDQGFTDLLSAALNESGLTEDFEDYNTSDVQRIPLVATPPASPQTIQFHPNPRGIQSYVQRQSTPQFKIRASPLLSQNASPVTPRARAMLSQNASPVTPRARAILSQNASPVTPRARAMNAPILASTPSQKAVKNVVVRAVTPQTINVNGQKIVVAGIVSPQQKQTTNHSTVPSVPGKAGPVKFIRLAPTCQSGLASTTKVLTKGTAQLQPTGPNVIRLSVPTSTPTSQVQSAIQNMIRLSAPPNTSSTNVGHLRPAGQNVIRFSMPASGTGTTHVMSTGQNVIRVSVPTAKSQVPTVKPNIVRYSLQQSTSSAPVVPAGRSIIRVAMPSVTQHQAAGNVVQLPATSVVQLPLPPRTITRIASSAGIAQATSLVPSHGPTNQVTSVVTASKPITNILPVSYSAPISRQVVKTGNVVGQAPTAQSESLLQPLSKSNVPSLHEPLKRGAARDITSVTVSSVRPITISTVPAVSNTASSSLAAVSMTTQHSIPLVKTSNALTYTFPASHRTAGNDSAKSQNPLTLSGALIPSQPTPPVSPVNSSSTSSQLSSTVTPTVIKSADVASSSANMAQVSSSSQAPVTLSGSTPISTPFPVGLPVETISTKPVAENSSDLQISCREKVEVSTAVTVSSVKSTPMEIDSAASKPIGSQEADDIVAELFSNTKSTNAVEDIAKKDVTEETGGFDGFDFGGLGESDEVDMFSQALQQLTYTNQQAAEFEAKKKEEQPLPKLVGARPASSYIAPGKTDISMVTTSVTEQLPSSVNVAGKPLNGSLVVTSSGLAHSSSAPEFANILTSVDGGRAASPIVLTRRGQSPLTIIDRANSPLTISGRNSPQVVRISTTQSSGQPGATRLLIQPRYSYSSSGLISGSTTPQLIQSAASPSPQVVKVLPSISTPLSERTSLAGMRRVLSTAMQGVTSPVGVARAVSADGLHRHSSLTGNGIVKTQLTDRDVSRIWANDDIKLKKLATGIPQAPNIELEEEAVEEDEGLGQAETYAEYMPSKLKIGHKHPDPVVETSSLGSVEPCNIWYNLSIPEVVVDYGYLSALQLETIVYASQKHEVSLASGESAGFLIGDGAGVGKGRTIAGLIYENYLNGRKRSLWLSVSNDLRVDAERDLRDIGAGKIEVYALNKFKYAKISSKINGSVKKGVIFATYSSLIGESQSGGKYRTRFKQLLHWLGKDFDGIIVFDECHKAKNLCPVGSSKPTKTGKTVLELQNRLPRARIVYASATGASEPKNMAYMTRLGLWGAGTPFKEFSDFIQAIEKRGVGAMELVAMDMKLRGMYIARQLSFHGVSFKVEEINISDDFMKIYNEAVKVWVDARDMFQRAADLIDAEHRMRKTMWGQFWSAHQRFFKYLCISAKVRQCVLLARDAVKNGKCVVIGLQSTGEARTLEQLEESGGELNDFVSTAKGVLQTLAEKHFPAPDRKKTFDMFGIGSSQFDDSPKHSPKSRKKRKNNSAPKHTNLKKMKSDWSEDSDDESEDDTKATTPKPSSDDDFKLSDSEEDWGDGSEDEDINPFGRGSDSDEDPWLKRSKPKRLAKPVKEKKEKKEKSKKKKSKKDSDDDDDIDKEFDRALEAAGLKTNKENLFSWNSRQSTNSVPAMDAVDKAVAMKRALLDHIEHLGEKLPPNTLDQLIDELGGPECVAEMTGRKGRVVSNEDGNVQYESRSESDAPLEILNLIEKQRFMDGEKNIAIISEAASSGISLQADRRAINQRKRVHITLELPWSADRAIQQFGRTHRSNQVSAPDYIFLISDLAGERRFASTVAKRLESLGALTHGDRRATETRDLSRFNIDNKYGRAALESVMKSVLHAEVPVVPPPKDYPGNFFEDCKIALIGVGVITCDEKCGFPMLDKDYNNISKFLNRILGMPVKLQNYLFQYFTDTLKTIILQAKRNGRWDLGIMDLGSGGEKVHRVQTKTFLGTFSGSTTKIELNTVSVERGLNWEAAIVKWQEHSGSDDGFYISRETRNQRKSVILAVAVSGKRKDRHYAVYRPNTGQQTKRETLVDIKRKWKKVLPDEAQFWWEDQFNASATICIHAYWNGSCKKASIGLGCEIGLRSRTYYVLSGSVLSVWTRVESVLASIPGGHSSRMQIIRLRTDDGSKIVGTLIPTSALTALINMLSQDSKKVENSAVARSQSGHSISTTFPQLSATAPSVSGSINQQLSMPMFL